MLRNHLNQRVEADKDFRWRGGDVSRIEALSDAVFAIAIALLVVSLEVPRTFEDLLQTVQGFVAFAITLTAVISIWYGHYIYFRRYGFEDAVTIVLNSALLFVVLFYIYPLKFLATALITHGVLKRLMGFNITGQISIMPDQWPTLMIIYSAGFIALFVIFMLLYYHAYRKRADLNLNKTEAFLTKSSIRSYGILSCFGIASVMIAATDIPFNAFWAGIVYWLVGPVMTVFGIKAKKRLEILREEDAADGET